MSTVIYFDQNALSDLRKRKREDKEEFNSIYNVIVDRKLRVLYSYTHLDEIRNISVEKYRDEHIEMLQELKARYIKPLNSGIDIRTAWTIWHAYIDNKAENAIDGGAEAEILLEKLNKKISGLPVEESFFDIYKGLKNSILRSAMEMEEILLSMTHEELAFNGISANEVKAQILGLKKQALKMAPLIIPENEELGPKVFRNWLQSQGKCMSHVPSDEIIEEIGKLFIDASGRSIEQEQIYDETDLSKVAKAYSLMNWAGYYPDDFTSLKKGKDRFKASEYDMNHVAHAIPCDYLVSSDVKFSKKAKACYSHMGVKTKVVTPVEFIENCL